MKALVIYTVFVAIGAAVSSFIGLFVEREVSSGASLIVFLVLLFSNFVVSWILVILIMDGSLKNADGRKEQLEIERQARLVEG
jgi:hypothetical protein